MIARCGPALEADFQHYYRLDLADLWRGKITIRRAALLAAYLPRGSMTGMALGGPPAITTETEEIWGIQYLLQQRLHQAAGGKGPKPKFREYPQGAEAERRKAGKAAARAERFRRRNQRNQ